MIPTPKRNARSLHKQETGIGPEILSPEGSAWKIAEQHKKSTIQNTRFSMSGRNAGKGFIPRQGCQNVAVGETHGLRGGKYGHPGRGARGFRVANASGTPAGVLLLGWHVDPGFHPGLPSFPPAGGGTPLNLFAYFEYFAVENLPLIKLPTLKIS